MKHFLQFFTQRNTSRIPVISSTNSIGSWIGGNFWGALIVTGLIVLVIAVLRQVGDVWVW